MMRSVCALVACKWGCGASQPAFVCEWGRGVSQAASTSARQAVRSGRTPRVSCSLNGTRAKIVNCHMVSGSAKVSTEGKDCVSKLAPAIKGAAITELCDPAATQL